MAEPAKKHPIAESKPEPAASGYRAHVWRENPRETIHRAWRYSIFVKVMKRTLPIIALGLGVAVLTYVLQSRDTPRTNLTFEQVDKIENDLTMVKPELTGTDDDGLPFTIHAQTATQVGAGSQQVKLENLSADITLKHGGMLHVTAAHGLADTQTHLLDISGGIHVTSDDGYEVRTETASADLKSGIIHGESPIEAMGRLGHVTANRFALNQMTGELRFSGNVRMVLNSAALKTKGTVE